MILSKILMAFANEWKNFQERVIQLVNESIPGLATDLIEEWEEDLGLPDTCSKLAATLEERSEVAHVKYTQKYDGQSRQFYLSYASSLGFTIKIVDSSTTFIFRVDKNRVDRTPADGINGARLGGIGIIHKWSVEIVNSSPTISDEYLKCRFEQIKPAHTQIIWVN